MESWVALSSIADVQGVLEEHALTASCAVRAASTGYIELDVSPPATRGRGAARIIVLAWPQVWRDRAALEPHLRRARSGNYALTLIGNEAEIASVEATPPTDPADITTLVTPISSARLLRAIRERADTAALRLGSATMELELDRARRENDMLINVGRALSNERDLTALLSNILSRARDVTGADAGSVYIVDNQDEDVTSRTLRFVATQNDSRIIAPAGFTLKVSPSSIVGTCVLSSDVINIPDLYALDAPRQGNNPWGFVHDRSMDDKYRYQARSMLTVPMISARAQVIGVIQLINKRAKGYATLDDPRDFDHGVVAFDDASIAFATSLSSQAGIALENAMLYDEVKTLFEGFVKASVTAIESRDPTTSGHSERVATLTTGLARAVDSEPDGRFADVTFSRDDLTVIEYAGLLHDFGKVGVREHVLTKAKKLYEHQRELIVERFRFIRRGFEVEGLTKKVQYLTEASREKMAEQLAGVDVDVGARLRELDDMIAFVFKANEPTVLDQGGFERIAEIAARSYATDDGGSLPYLRPEESSALQIIRGSLTDSERDEINSHVVHTFNFLSAIPWGRQFRQVPAIAGAHHEKLDGSGYPRHQHGDSIPLAARMMTVADIYDALTASDRPYKKAMPSEKALDILNGEVKRNLIDADLFKIFVESKVYTLVGG